MKRPAPALLIAGTALLVIAVLLLRGNSCGHDFDFHLLSWMEVARAWHTGLLYPHWVLNSNYGAGEPRLIFYPPASWLLGAALGTLTSWHAAPVLFVWLALLMAGASMYQLVRAWAPESSATFAACLYIANPYTLFVVYERTAYGELLAAAWLPLMVLYALRRQASVAPLGLSIAALWLSNSPAAVVGSYLLALLALFLCIAERNPRPALRAAGGIVLGLALAAFYIVPAVIEQRWVQIDRAILPGIRVQDSFLFGHTGDPLHDQVLHTASWIFVAEFVFACCAAWVARRKAKASTVRATLTAVLPVILLLQLPVSALVWQYAPHLKFLQFPWRWVMALSVIACVLAGLAMKRGRGPAVIAATAIVAMSLGCALLFFAPCDDEDAVTPQIAAFQAGDGVVGTDEYTPRLADNAAVQQHLPLVRVLRAAQGDGVTRGQGDNPEWHSPAAGSAVVSKIDARRPDGEHWAIQIAAPEAGYAVLRLMDYPSWNVRVDGHPVSAGPLRKDGLLTVPIGSGNHTIDVRWQATNDILFGRALSALGLLALIGVLRWERIRNRKESLTAPV